jgi:hypothetical protein
MATDISIATATALNLITQTLVALNKKNVLSSHEIREIAQRVLDGSGTPEQKSATKELLNQLLPSIQLR